MAEIGCLWIGGALSFLEVLCLRSMMAHGNRVTLFSYEPVENLPNGVMPADAAEIAPMDTALLHRKTGSPALQSDLFRYRLLKARPGMVWCDADMLFLAPLPESPYLFGYEGPGRINGAVLALPSDSSVLDALLEFCSSSYPVPPWLPVSEQAELAETPVHVSDMGWGVWGPVALSYFIEQEGLAHQALAQEVLYPVAFRDVRDLILRQGNWQRWITPETRAVHLYGRATRRIVRERFGGVPPWHGFLGRMLRDYEIRTGAAPLASAE